MGGPAKSASRAHNTVTARKYARATEECGNTRGKAARRHASPARGLHGERHGSARGEIGGVRESGATARRKITWQHARAQKDAEAAGARTGVAGSTRWKGARGASPPMARCCCKAVLPGAAFTIARATKASLARMERRASPGRRIGCWMIAISPGSVRLKYGADQTHVMKMP